MMSQELLKKKKASDFNCGPSSGFLNHYAKAKNIFFYDVSKGPAPSTQQEPYSHYETQ